MQQELRKDAERSNQALQDMHGELAAAGGRRTGTEGQRYERTNKIAGVVAESIAEKLEHWPPPQAPEDANNDEAGGSMARSSVLSHSRLLQGKYLEAHPCSCGKEISRFARGLQVF
eukprot:764684-Hanusia_phi.AAC.1